jgi:hypothetical protein
LRHFDVGVIEVIVEPIFVELIFCHEEDFY